MANDASYFIQGRILRSKFDSQFKERMFKGLQATLPSLHLLGEALRNKNPLAAGSIQLSMVCFLSHSHRLSSNVWICSTVLKKLNEWDVDDQHKLAPLSLNKSFNLFNRSISCPPATAGVNVDVAAQASAVVAIGIVAAGTFIPPMIDDFVIVSSEHCRFVFLTFKSNSPTSS